MAEKSEQQTIIQSLKLFLRKEIIAMLFFGISAGIPLLLIFSSLSLWLNEAGVEKAAVTFFSWAALGYSFKFVWAPLVDRLPLPILAALLGQRRSWILFAQSMIVVAICWMAFTNPAEGQNQLTIMALAAVLLGFSSATQDIVIDAYRIESGPREWQALMSSTYIAGYRIGMLITGAGALYLADIFGSSKENYSYLAWQNTYLIMAATMLIGIFTTLLVKEPSSRSDSVYLHSSRDYFRFFLLFIAAVSVFIATFVISLDWSLNAKTWLAQIISPKGVNGFIVESIRFVTAITLAFMAIKLLVRFRLVNQNMVQQTYIDPLQEFFSRYHLKTALFLLALIGFYRISDIVLGVIANLFYQDIGFSKSEIASAVKVFGVLMSLLGGFLGGFVALRLGVMKTLFYGALLTVLTNLMFLLLAYSGNNLILLYVVVSADNITAGLASAAFVAFLSALTNIKFTAIQYAIFSSLMTLMPKILGGFSGSVVDSVGYIQFFIIASAIGIPVLWLVVKAGLLLKVEDKSI